MMWIPFFFQFPLVKILNLSPERKECPTYSSHIIKMYSPDSVLSSYRSDIYLKTNSGSIETRLNKQLVIIVNYLLELYTFCRWFNTWETCIKCISVQLCFKAREQRETHVHSLGCTVTPSCMRNKKKYSILQFNDNFWKIIEFGPSLIKIITHLIYR